MKSACPLLVRGSVQVLWLRFAVFSVFVCNFFYRDEIDGELQFADYIWQISPHKVLDMIPAVLLACRLVRDTVG